MADTTPRIFFIAGATRGLGLAFVADIASKYPSAIVYAGARDPASSGASALDKLAEKYPGRVRVVRYVAADEEGNRAVAKDIQREHGRVDVVVANAAICGALAPVHELDIDAYKEHFTVNVVGPIVLFKAFYQLLKASADPKFVPITSIGGSLVATTSWPLQATCYSSSKAALNWVARKIHFENEWLVCFPLSPGAVDTEMLGTTIKQDRTGSFGVSVREHGTQSPEETADVLVDLIVAATREGDGGQFVHRDGSRLPW
ncbi:NAD(P)-binding protein [Pholiota molesta]|nr:NAD(P)-binding protein [Pholiota molesta]